MKISKDFPIGLFCFNLASMETMWAAQTEGLFLRAMYLFLSTLMLYAGCFLVFRDMKEEKE